MDVREKLVELFENHCAVIGEDNCKASQSGKCTPRDCAICLASNSISNGVTVQEWIPVKERLPEHGDVVLCFMKFGEHRILQWDNVSSLWLGYGHGDDWQKADVTHWMPLPQPPKGE